MVCMIWVFPQKYMVPVLREKSYFSEIVLPWKLLELSRNRRKFNIITNSTNHIFNYFPYKIIFWWKKTVWKEIFNFFLFHCYGNQASLKFVKKSWTNLMDTTFEAMYKRSMSYYFNIYIYERKKLFGSSSLVSKRISWPPSMPSFNKLSFIFSKLW